MGYGARMYDASGRDITGIFTPVFFLGSYTQASGNVNYGNPPSGKALRYYVIGTADWTGTPGSSPSVSISGGNASWSGIDPSMSRIVFFFGP